MVDLAEPQVVSIDAVDLPVDTTFEQKFREFQSDERVVGSIQNAVEQLFLETPLLPFAQTTLHDDGSKEVSHPLVDEVERVHDMYLFVYGPDKADRFIDRVISAVIETKTLELPKLQTENPTRDQPANTGQPLVPWTIGEANSFRDLLRMRDIGTHGGHLGAWDGIIKEFLAPQKSPPQTIVRPVHRA